MVSGQAPTRPTVTPQAVIDARIAVGLSQAELAAAVGCSVRTIQYWETRGGNPHPRLIRALAAATGHPIAGFYRNGNAADQPAPGPIDGVTQPGG